MHLEMGAFFCVITNNIAFIQVVIYSSMVHCIMDRFSLDILWIFLFSVGYYIVKYFFNREKLQKKKFVQQEDYSTVAKAHGQKVKIVGIVQIQEKYLESPISGEACVYYEVEVKANHFHKAKWYPLLKDKQASLITMQTKDQDLFAINLGTTELNVSSRFANVCSTSLKFTDSMEVFLRSHNILKSDYHSFWIKETLIKAGDRIEIVGAAFETSIEHVFEIGPTDGTLHINILDQKES